METSPTMGRVEFGRLSAAWRGEASDFTPLLSQQLDLLGEAIELDLVSVGKAEVATDGGRRIDIVASTDDGSESLSRINTAGPTTITSPAVSPTRWLVGLVG